MQKLIEQLKQKPESHRRQVALGVSALFTALVFVVWLSVLMPQGQSQIVAERQKVDNKETAPLETLKDGMAGVYGAFKGIFKKDADINLESEFEKIKNQVESGQIRILPESTSR